MNESKSFSVLLNQLQRGCPMLAMLRIFPLNLSIALYILSGVGPLLAPRHDPMFHLAITGHILATVYMLATMLRISQRQTEAAYRSLEHHKFSMYPGVEFSIGSPKAFLGREGKSKPEKIRYCAMIDRNHVLYVGDAPMTHRQVRQFATSRDCAAMESYGWLTSNGRYVDAQEAWAIAVDAGQVMRNDGNADNSLHPHHLWPTDEPAAQFA